MTPGPLELMVHYFNDTGTGTKSGTSYSSSRPRYLTFDYPMNMNQDGWNRWEAIFPTDIQLRLVEHNPHTPISKRKLNYAQ
jgi:hypothetical protein